MDEQTLQFLKQTIQITDEDLEKMSPGAKKVYTNVLDKMKWKVIAEVTYSKYCIAGLKVGDKLVFNFPLINTVESTAAPCIGAIFPLVGYIRNLLDRVAEGLDPNESMFAPFVHDCQDPGLEQGGLGHVRMKLYAVKGD
jgi:hypothetical protein